MKFHKQIISVTARLWIGVLLGLIIGSCNSEDNHPLTAHQLTDEDCNEAPAAIFLNGERLTNASVMFTSSPDAGSVTMTLSGVHPTEKIKLDVQTTSNEVGNILFNGELNTHNLYDIKIDGFYKPKSISTLPLVRINILYTVPDEITSKTYTIPFDENSGFCYQKYSNMETSSQADSLRFICNRINIELAKHLKSITFRFDTDGVMTFEYTDTKQVVNKHTFRYWISKQDWSGDNIVHIEEPEMFYDCLLNSLIPEENRALATFPYSTEVSSATLFIHEYHNYMYAQSIVLIGDIHQKIYSYLYYLLLTDRRWTDEERDCFLLMMKQTGKFCEWGKPEVFDGYPWAFATLLP